MAGSTIANILEQAHEAGKHGESLSAQLIEQAMSEVTLSSARKGSDVKAVLAAKLAVREKVKAAHRRGTEGAAVCVIAPALAGAAISLTWQPPTGEG